MVDIGGLGLMAGDRGQWFRRGDHLSILGEFCVDKVDEIGVVTSDIGGIPRASENNGGGNHSFS